MRWFIVMLVGCGFEAQLGTGDSSGGEPDALDPDGDTDDDGILDVNDNCVSVRNPLQKNFDSDLKGDECDRCPHIALDADPDADGDGVGDACDPRPQYAGETRELWLGFYSPADITGWAQSRGDGVWIVADGKLSQTNGASAFALLDSPKSYTDAYFATAVEIVTPNPLGEIGFCLGDDQSPPAEQYYCCGISGASTVRAVSAWPPGSVQQIDSTTWAANHGANQQVEMVGILLGSKFTCELSQGAIRSARETANGNKLGTAVFYTGALSRYRYLFVATLVP